MNIHHLELFYYVAKFGGITRAARRMPYGIQPPAISGQLSELEENLGVSLFQRRPFCLSAAGERLFRRIQPFFDSLDNLAQEIARPDQPRIRLGSSEAIFRDHLPPVLSVVKERFPGLQLSLRSGYQTQLLTWLEERQIDLMIGAIEERIPAGLEYAALLQVPLALVAPRKCPCRTGRELLASGWINQPLISLPPMESISRLFQKELRKRGLEWAPVIEASSLDLLACYVAAGFGIGIGLALPTLPPPAKVKTLLLEDFPRLEVVACWRPSPSAVVEAFVHAARDYIAKSGFGNPLRPHSSTALS